MKLRLAYSDKTFAQLFADLSSAMLEGVHLLGVILADMRDVPAQVQRLKAIEHRGDDISHQLYSELNRTFITPFDREDIYQLASSLDDVLDLAFTAGQTLVTHRITSSTLPARELAAIIMRQARELVQAVSILRDHDRVLAHCEQVRHLEHEADGIARGALGALFETERDPIELIKLKGLYGVLERATDKAEDVADVLEAIILKQA
ncbi:MAG: DUF47 domain-containing protein [Terriglobales bacterium]